MKQFSKISFLTGFVSAILVSSALNTLHCQDIYDEENSSSQTKKATKLKYLELRGLNYDYVHFYKQSEQLYISWH